jgi:hypothetical protein
VFLNCYDGLNRGGRNFGENRLAFELLLFRPTNVQERFEQNEGDAGEAPRGASPVEVWLTRDLGVHSQARDSQGVFMDGVPQLRQNAWPFRLGGAGSQGANSVFRVAAQAGVFNLRAIESARVAEK